MCRGVMNSMCTFVQTSTVLAHQTLGQKGVGECSKSIEMCMSLNCRIFLWYMWLCLNMSGKPNLMPVFTSFHQFRMKFAQRLQGPQLISIDSIRQTQGPRVSRQFALRSLRSVTVAGRFPITSMIWPFKQI